MAERKSILIADDDPVFLQALRARCMRLGFDVHTARNGADVLESVIGGAPDLLITDVNMPVFDGLEICETLARRRAVEPLPMIVLTGRSDSKAIDSCMKHGAHYVFKDLEVWEGLTNLILSLLTPEAATAFRLGDDTELRGSKPKVLIVDDDVQITEALGIRLDAHGAEVLRAANGREGFLIALRDHPDAIITDYAMPDGNGEHMIVRLSNNPETADIPVIVITGRKVSGRKDTALERELVGRREASAYIEKPIEFPQLLDALSRHIKISRIPNQKRRVRH